MAGGIYALRNTVSGGFYIGSTNNFAYRRGYHFRRLRQGSHDNQRLQSSWNKYGEAAFEFVAVCLLDTPDLLVVEQRLLDRLYRHPRCYNLSRQANGSYASPEGIERIRRANASRRHSPETRAKMRAAHLGRPKTAEARAKMSAAKKGQPSPHRGRTHSAEVRERMRQAALRRPPRAPGRRHSDESRAKMSAAKMGNQYALGNRHSPETKAKIAAAHRTRGV